MTRLSSISSSPPSPIRRGARSWRGSPRGEATVNELVAPFDLSQPTISKHLKVLERAGLVSRGREAQFRPVRLNAAPLEARAHGSATTAASGRRASIGSTNT